MNELRKAVNDSSHSLPKTIYLPRFDISYYCNQWLWLSCLPCHFYITGFNNDFSRYLPCIVDCHIPSSVKILLSPVTHTALQAGRCGQLDWVVGGEDGWSGHGLNTELSLRGGIPELVPDVVHQPVVAVGGDKNVLGCNSAWDCWSRCWNFRGDVWIRRVMSGTWLGSCR